jgi:L-iditol 2-dehydrogenase
MSAVPSSCRAAALVALGQPLELVEVPVPAELESGALLVRTAVTTVCGTDVHMWQGRASTAHIGASLPLILGHEMMGRIVRFADRGPHVDSIGRPLTIGDRIVWTHGTCGRCESCVLDNEPSLCSNRQRYASSPYTTYPHLTGGFSEYCYVYPTSGRIRVPDSVSDELAAASSCALRTVIHGFERLGPVRQHETVVVQGAGPLGLFAVAQALSLEPRQVIVIGGPAQRLEVAKRWGASLTIDIADQTDPAGRRESILECTGGRGADVVVEVSGAPPAFQEGMDMLRPGGRYLVIGQGHTTPIMFNPSAIVFKQATIIGTLSGSVRHYFRALEFLETWAGRFSWDDLISHHFALDDVNRAMASMADLTAIKPAIDFR